jgi:23S rRNA (cytosine1962-C5)-methyltransferase/23S rRNA (guanine2445-N2)-methyltransferase / 23S rRNA (guanine2069-N7)-methyltransferase
MGEVYNYAHIKGKCVSQDYTVIRNRIQKNLKKLKSYLTKGGIEAYRLYNKDIPEYPYLIDVYGKEAVIYEQGKRLTEEEDALREKHQKHIEMALTEILAIPADRQHFKIRERQKGNDQYRPLDPKSNEFFVVDEPPMKFLVNLERYLDSGLFLDMRPLRQYLYSNSKDKKILNLFCYTGSLSVASALGGGMVTSVDMSRTYLDWAYENFLVNKIDPKNHVFWQADVLKDLLSRKENKERYDLIILDPPSFSNSKRMEEDLDIERDHPLLVRDCMQLLTPGGMLIFSTNKKKFELHTIVTSQYQVKEISQWTIPMDFHHTEIHRAWQLQTRI